MAITWEDAPAEQSAVYGQPYKVRCIVRANPPATIDWQRNGQSFQTSKPNLQSSQICNYQLFIVTQCVLRRFGFAEMDRCASFYRASYNYSRAQNEGRLK